MAEPLAHEGIDGVEIRRGKERLARIEKKELPYFRYRYEPPTEISTKEERMYLQVAKPDLDGGDKWYVRSGGEGFWVKILDDQFNKDVEFGKLAFASGDTLDAVVCITRKTTPDKTTYRHEVTKVHRLIPGESQRPLL